jgi:hypothetical protein
MVVRSRLAVARAFPDLPASHVSLVTRSHTAASTHPTTRHAPRQPAPARQPRTQIGVTMNVYTHVVQNTQREALATMDRLLKHPR